MRINTKYSIALHCLVLIAEYGDRRKVTGELLGKSTGCNAAAIRSILTVLKKAGIIAIARGVGGARLDCDPQQLNLWQIYCALEPEGLDRLIGMHPHPFEQCPVGRRIGEVLAEPYAKMSAALQQSMQGITLMQLTERYRTLEH